MPDPTYPAPAPAGRGSPPELSDAERLAQAADDLGLVIHLGGLAYTWWNRPEDMAAVLRCVLCVTRVHDSPVLDPAREAAERLLVHIAAGESLGERNVAVGWSDLASGTSHLQSKLRETAARLRSEG